MFLLWLEFFAIIITIGMFLLIIIEDIRDYIRITKHRMKREYEITHRFEKKPLAKCYCIDCIHCRGFTSDNDHVPRAIPCDLWDVISLHMTTVFVIGQNPKCERRNKKDD